MSEYYSRGARAKLESIVRELGYKLGDRELRNWYGKGYHDIKVGHDKALRKLNRINKVA